MNSISSSFIASSASIPYPYLLAITAYSSSVSAMVVGIRVGIRVVRGWGCQGEGIKVRVFKYPLNKSIVFKD